MDGGVFFLTPAVNFDSRKFRGHLLSPVSAIGGAGGFQRTKYGRRPYAPAQQESMRNGHTGMLPFELQILWTDH